MTSQSTYDELVQRMGELEEQLAGYRSCQECDRLNRQHLQDILNNTNMPVYLKNADFQYVFINTQFEHTAHVTLDQIKGKDDFAIFPEPVARLFRDQDEEVVRRRSLVEFEESISLPDGIQTFITTKFPLFDNQGMVEAVGGVCTDITARKKAEEKLRKAHAELERRVAERTEQLNQKTARLMETNVALKILLEKRQEDKRDLETKVMSNLEKLIRPYLEKLRLRCSDDFQQSLIRIIQSNLDEITSSFSKHHTNFRYNLTPAQIQIADLIRQGHTTKEIAALLNLSPATIACHRQEIRKRLSLTHKKIHLQSVLMTAHNNEIE